MIKARLQLKDGQPLVVLGLSGENITRLMADEPILFNLADVGLGDGKLMVIGGRTEGAIIAQLQTAGLLPEQLPDGTH